MELCDTLAVVISLLSLQTMLSETSANIIAEEVWTVDQDSCPGFDSKQIANPDIPWGIPDRAYRTAPPEICIKTSNIPGAGLGTFATTFIPKYTWLCEYEGYTVTPEESGYISWYAWTVNRGNMIQRYIDGGEIELSNWARFVNMPNNIFDENVGYAQCYDKIYYYTLKDIHPWQELLVNYGPNYAKQLGIHEQFELSEVLRDMERTTPESQNLRNVVSELKKLVGLSGKNITRSLKTLLEDDSSALSITMGDSLKSRLQTLTNDASEAETTKPSDLPDA